MTSSERKGLGFSMKACVADSKIRSNFMFVYKDSTPIVNNR